MSKKRNPVFIPNQFLFERNWLFYSNPNDLKERQREKELRDKFFKHNKF